MHDMFVYATKYELDSNFNVDYYLDSNMIEEIYFLENDTIYTFLRLFDIWCQDLNFDNDGKIITLDEFEKAKAKFNSNKNIIEEYAENDNVMYRAEKIQEFFDYVENYIQVKKLKYLLIQTDYFS